MINPYGNVNWSTVQRIMSISHEHCDVQTQFDRIVGGGARHLAISNYYPSKPVYPLSEKFSNIPQDAISCPNAEHHHMNIERLHLNGLGSTFQSGSQRGSNPIGCNSAQWSVIVPQILRNLLYDDGGGVTINHPTWTGLSQKDAQAILDFDSRVLGIEFYNDTCEIDPNNPPGTGWALELWDSILVTGRRCWGFAVADHSGQDGTGWRGRNILLVPDVTEHECLKAYRNGAFYGQLGRTNLAFAEITYSSGTLHAAADNATVMTVVIDGESTDTQGNEVTVSVPASAVYVRVEAHTTEDAIYSNPIMVNPKTYKKPGMTGKHLLFMS